MMRDKELIARRRAAFAARLRGDTESAPDPKADAGETGDDDLSGVETATAARPRRHLLCR